MTNNPIVVCFCGSTRFKDEFIEANKQETLKGNIVLTVGVFRHKEEKPLSEKQIILLDELHLRKIDLADEILVIDKDKYIGTGTSKELWYAIQRDKTIRYWSEEYPNWPDNKSLKFNKNGL